MNKEQIIDEAYKNYSNEYEKGNAAGIRLDDGTERVANIDEFIRRIRVDSEFAEKWGLKIEERELSYDERFRIAYKNLELRNKLEAQSKMLHYPEGHNNVMDNANIPTKLITITYNNETIESYE